MVSSKTDIANMALSLLGTANHIVSLDTDTSEEAKAIRQFYPTARDQMLQDGIWKFARAITTLALVSENPTIEWGFSYQLPSDCLKALRIPNGTRRETQANRIPFDVYGQLLYTDAQEPQLEYTPQLTNEGLFPPHFPIALAHLLAYYAAGRLTAGDPTGIGQRCLTAHYYWLGEAHRADLNQGVPDIPPEAAMITARS